MRKGLEAVALTQKAEMTKKRKDYAIPSWAI